MEFSKQFMTIKELVNQGLSETNLRNMAAVEGYPLVIRESTKKTSPIKFDTFELNKYFLKQTKLWEGKRQS